MSKISAVYKIINTITGDFYVGSSKNVKSRWTSHKCPSRWNRYKNNPMYLDMRKYGVDKFSFQILAEVEIEQLKEVEQQFIEKLQPTYNRNRANGWDVERYKETRKEYGKEYRKTDKSKEYQKQYQLEYENQLCLYNGETITLSTLRTRFRKLGIPHPVKEAKKYLLGGCYD